MSWQVEVAIVVVILVLSLGVTAYVVGLGGSGRRTRKVREQLESMIGSTVTVVIGTLEDQELRSLSRVRGKVVEVQSDRVVLTPSEGSSAGAWVWPVDDGTVRVRLERIVGIEGADGETVYT
jgi:hypothetical protein